MALLQVLLFTIVLVGKSTSNGPLQSERIPEKIPTQESVIFKNPNELSANVGDTVVFPCKVGDAGQGIIVWKRGRFGVIFAGGLRVDVDKKFELLEKASLQINEVTSSYAGEYICQVGPEEAIYVLHVLVPPVIKLDPEDGLVIVKKGDSITATCNAEGYPLPRITWTSQKGTLPGNVKEKFGSLLSIAWADEKHSGTYECTAENGVGLPVSETLKIKVLYAPKVNVTPKWQHAGQGSTVELKCEVDSVPPSYIRWATSQNSHLQQDKHITLVSPKENELILKIRRITEEHFGSYNCHANNTIGSTYMIAQVSGMAEKVKFKNNSTGDESDSFLLLWSVKSFSPVYEYLLRLRKISDGNSVSSTWTDVMIPVEGGQSVLHSHSYNITGLEPGSQYEVVMQAKNEYGWNYPSKNFMISTRKSDGSPPDNWERRNDHSSLHSNISLFVIDSSDVVSGNRRLIWSLSLAVSIIIPVSISCTKL